MTGFASEIFYFIKCKSDGSFLLRLMTSGAGDIYVLAIEFECGLIVIKPGWMPVIGNMTWRTVSHTIFNKLTMMDIMMTRVAVTWKLSEFLDFSSGAAFLYMTGST